MNSATRTVLAQVVFVFVACGLGFWLLQDSNARRFEFVRDGLAHAGNVADSSFEKNATDENGALLLRDGSFVVASGDRVERLVTLQRGARVLGRLFDETGKVFPGATIMLTKANEPNRNAKHTRTNSKGEFSYPAVAPGRWLLRGTHRDEKGVTRVASKAVDLIAGEQPSHELRIKAGVSVCVTVLSPQPAPMIVVRSVGSVLPRRMWFCQASKAADAEHLVEVRGLEVGEWEAAIFNARKKAEEKQRFFAPRRAASALVLDLR